MMNQEMRFDIDVIGAIFLGRPDLADGNEISDALEFMLGAETLHIMGIREAWQLCLEHISEWHGSFFEELSQDISLEVFTGWYEYSSGHYDGLPLYKVEA